MATLTSDLQLIWTTDTVLALGFAVKDDLMTGDMTISKDVDLDGIINEAWMEIEALLGQRYSTPIHPTDNLPHYTVQFLTRVHAYMATSILMLGQGGASESGLSYSVYLRERADHLLQPVVDGTRALDGIPNSSIHDESTANRGPALFVGDAESPFAFWEDTVHSTTVTQPGARRVWRPSPAFVDPNA